MMYAWHYSFMRSEHDCSFPIKGTLCSPDIDTIEKARDHIAFQYGRAAAETARIRKAGEEEHERS